MTRFFILLSLYYTSYAISSYAQSSQNQVEGVAVYMYQNYGPKPPIETRLTFKDNKAWYNRHHKKENITTEEGYNFYYYKELKDWYYLNDSLYFFSENESYSPFFGRWATEPIEWEITDETQMITGYLARKAITKSLEDTPPDTDPAFALGNVVAWFTTEIPLNFGPDGYYGLPGLIIKLEYSNMERIYKTTLKSIEFKEIEDWKLPSLEKKIEVSKDHAYNPWKLGKKWFKKKQKELGF